MKVGIIGSGGREHALCYAIKKSEKVKKIYFTGPILARDISVVIKSTNN